MRRKSFFICFTGIDGTGKTTLSKELVELLNEKGIKCKYVYARLNTHILKPFVLFGEWIFLRGKDVFKDYSEYSNTKRKAIKKHPLLSSVYRQILLFDYFFQVFFTVKFPLIILGKNIVCDRYVYDTVVTDISVDMDYSRDMVITLLNNLLRFFPKPDITFLIDAPEEIAYQRKNDTPSVNYLRERSEMYLDIGKEYGMTILDGYKDLTVLKEEVQKEIFEYIKRGDIK